MCVYMYLGAVSLLCVYSPLHVLCCMYIYMYYVLFCTHEFIQYIHTCMYIILGKDLHSYVFNVGCSCSTVTASEPA